MGISLALDGLPGPQQHIDLFLARESADEGHQRNIGRHPSAQRRPCERCASAAARMEMLEVHAQRHALDPHRAVFLEIVDHES